MARAESAVVSSTRNVASALEAWLRTVPGETCKTSAISLSVSPSLEPENQHGPLPPRKLPELDDELGPIGVLVGEPWSRTTRKVDQVGLGDRARPPTPPGQVFVDDHPAEVRLRLVHRRDSRPAALGLDRYVLDDVLSEVGSAAHHRREPEQSWQHRGQPLLKTHPSPPSPVTIQRV